MNQEQVNALHTVDWYLQHGDIPTARDKLARVIYPKPKPVDVSTPPSSLRDAIVKVAAGEVGVREDGHNSGDRIRQYQRATWLPPGTWPWCAAFVCWVLREARKLHRAPWAKRPRTAGAFDFENWATDKHPSSGAAMMRSGGIPFGVELLKPPKPEYIEPGDILVFKFSHIGIAASKMQGTVCETIEGNTNPGGSRDGDGVYRRTRKLEHIRSIIKVA